MPHDNHIRRHKRDAKPEPATTLVSYVYVTASPTFEGPIAGYSTLGGDDKSTSAFVTSYYVLATIGDDVVSWLTTQTIGAADAIANPSSSTPASTTAKESKTAATSTPNSALAVDTSSVVTDPSTTMANSQTSVVVAQSTFHTSAAPSKTTATSSESSSTALATTANSTSSGLSGSGIAGIIIGIIGFAIAAWAIFWCVNRRNKKKRAAAQAMEQEKEAYTRNDILAATAATRRSPSNAVAPQLNAIRPMTEFGSSFSGSEQSMNAGASQGGQWNEKMELNKENPFGTHAAASSNEENETNPFGNHAATQEGQKIFAAGAMARRSSKELPYPLDMSRAANMQGRPSNLSPTGSMASSMMTSMASNDSGKPSNVHRVQIDFKPSLPDEIELNAGQLVRLLHAYDDGWCEVTQLNGANKGICPRTCLSNRPIKPRPRGPQQPGRPMTPTQRIPIVPQGRSPATSISSQISTQSPTRLMAPGQARPMTAGSGVPQGFALSGQQSPRPRSPSMSQGRSQSPAMSQGRPQSPASPAFPTGYNKALPLGPGESRPRSPSVSQNPSLRQNGPGPSRMNPAASLHSIATTAAPADQSPVTSFVEESSEDTTAPLSPKRSFDPSQVPLPQSPIGRKPLPGSAL